MQVQHKNEHYREIADCDSLHWSVLGHEVYGFTLPETSKLLRQLAKHKAEKTNNLARRTAIIYWCTRFWDRLACTLVRSVSRQFMPHSTIDPAATYVPTPAPLLEDLL